MGLHYQVKSGGANDWRIEGDGVEILAGYGRDHDRNLGAGTFTAKLGSTRLVLHQILAQSRRQGGKGRERVSLCAAEEHLHAERAFEPASGGQVSPARPFSRRVQRGLKTRLATAITECFSVSSPHELRAVVNRLERILVRVTAVNYFSHAC